jgi:hypothetical protein
MTRIAVFIALISAISSPAADQPRGRYLCAFQDEKVVAGIDVKGCRANWSKTSADENALERPDVRVPAAAAGALHLVLLPGDQFSSLEITGRAGMPADWTGFGRLLFTAVNGSEFMIPLVLTVRDDAGATYASSEIWLARARNTFEIPLTELTTTQGKPLRLARIRSVSMEIRSAEKFERDIWIYNLLLATDVPAAVVRGSRTALFDFGPPGAALVPGAKPVSAATGYAVYRGFGWTALPPETQSWALKKPERLTADWVWADLGGRDAVFRVDLPAGRYRARFYGGNYSSKLLPVLSFSLAANGHQVVSRRVDPDSYYSDDEYFRGRNDWYEPGEDIYRKWVADLWQKYDFPFEVRDGHVEFAWQGVLCVFGLLIAPDGNEFETAAAAVEKVRRMDFLANVHLPAARPKIAALPESAQERGFLLWSREFGREVGPHDLPEKPELDPRTLVLAAARDDFAHAAVTATPLRPLGSVELRLSEFRKADGTMLPPGYLKIRALKYMWEDWPAELKEGCLLPVQKVPSAADVNVTFWLTLAPGADAAPGLYSGTARIFTGAGGSAEVPVAITIHPFPLTTGHPVSYAFFRSSPYNLNYSLRYFLPGRIDDLRRLLRAEARLMKAHGLTSYMFTPPFVKGVDGDRMLLDFSLVEEEVRAAKDAGLCDAERPGLVLLVLDIARRLTRETRYGDFFEPEELSLPLPDRDLTPEFSPQFIRRFLDGTRQIHEFFETRGVPVLLQLADEPRERNINQWNRNLRDVLRYAQIVRDSLPGAKLFVDPMRDSEDGVNFLPLVEHFDVIATHPWDQSAGLMDAIRKNGKRLWYFNGIPDRYDFGFQMAASDSHGFWQWHFGWDLLPFQRFHPYNRSGVTLPGPEGPIETPAFERLTAGIGDYRYIATLKQRIEAAKREGKASTAIASAEADLARLLAACLPYMSKQEYASPLQRRRRIDGRTPDEWRAVLARHIVALN